jgi:hypothetical protein
MNEVKLRSERLAKRQIKMPQKDKISQKDKAKRPKKTKYP